MQPLHKHVINNLVTSEIPLRLDLTKGEIEFTATGFAAKYSGIQSNDEIEDILKETIYVVNEQLSFIGDSRKATITGVWYDMFQRTIAVRCDLVVIPPDLEAN